MSKYENITTIDLRNIQDVEVARQIEEIVNVAVVIMPSDAAPELQATLSAIPLTNVAQILYLRLDDPLRIINGMHELSPADLPQGQRLILVCNGMGIIRKPIQFTNGEIYINGMLLIDKKIEDQVSLPIAQVNGRTLVIDFDEIMQYQGGISIDLDMVTYLKPKTLIISAGNTTFEPDVTVEALENSGAVFYCVGNLQCPKHLKGYVKARITTIGSIEVYDLNDEPSGDEQS